MESNDTIKALEGAILNAKGCDSKVWSIEIYKLENALDLITQQQAENENLKVENQSLRSAANSLKMHYEEAQAEVERLKKLLTEEETKYNKCAKWFYKEAIKEFAERLKNEINIRTTLSREQDKNVMRMIDNLIKEMVGDDNE